jgi:hypothetical protein
MNTFDPTQLCEGPVFPTPITLCHGTSVDNLTSYTSRCVKHNLEIDSGCVSSSFESPFIILKFISFRCSLWLVIKISCLQPSALVMNISCLQPSTHKVTHKSHSFTPQSHSDNTQPGNLSPRFTSEIHLVVVYGFELSSMVWFVSMVMTLLVFWFFGCITSPNLTDSPVLLYLFVYIICPNDTWYINMDTHHVSTRILVCSHAVSHHTIYSLLSVHTHTHTHTERGDRCKFRSGFVSLMNIQRDSPP